MTYTKLLGFGFGLALVLTILKTIFYTRFAWEDAFGLQVFFWIVAVVLATALVRRLGVITFLEAILVIVLWLLFQIICDLIIALPVAGWRILVDASFALGYVAVVVAIFLFHKKRHIHKRRELKANKG